MVDHIHANGQKAGIYWIPGIEQPAVDGNYPILGTPYHNAGYRRHPACQRQPFAANPPIPTTIKSTSPSLERRSTLTRS